MEIGRYIVVGKSRYKGVHKRTSGTWYYRIKRIKNGEVSFIQESGFDTEELAYHARKAKLQSISTMPQDKIEDDAEFGVLFRHFLTTVKSESSRKKYSAMYSAQLKVWDNRRISTINNSDIDVLMLRLTLNSYSESYIASIRKLLNQIFSCSNSKSDLVKGIQTKLYRLRVLSLFSGIGAAEQALKNLGIDFELINFCEIDPIASKAYSLLHDVDDSKNLGDINCVTEDFCKNQLNNFDLMFFGFPCTDLSYVGDMKGFYEGNSLTRSGLLFKALEIAKVKRPKFMIAENVSALLSRRFSKEWNEVIKLIQNMGYDIYFDTLNSKDYGVPQSRNRVFIVMMRSDLNLKFEFPSPTGLTVSAENWFEENVDDEYYLKEIDFEVITKKNFKPNFNKDYISCLTTMSGIPNQNIRQTLVKDTKGVRCLTSRELMRFQGFPMEYADRLRGVGFSKNRIGKLVGNSITVNVLEEIFRSFISSLEHPLHQEILLTQVVEAKQNGDYSEPLFPMMGNKYRLLPYLTNLFPEDIASRMFVDLFAGTASVSLNSPSNKIIINEINPVLVEMYKDLSLIEPITAWGMVEKILTDYNFENEDDFYRCRDCYNSLATEQRHNQWAMLLAMLYYSFNNLLRFSKKGDFTGSYVGRKINLEKHKQKFFVFVEQLHKKKCVILNQEYNRINIESIDDDLFYYADPPYLVSDAAYTKAWAEDDEVLLYDFLDRLHLEGKQWMLSNVLENQGKENLILKNWLKANNDKYFVYHMKSFYSNSFYTRKTREQATEIVVTNYK